jgi:hypothetical protein
MVTVAAPFARLRLAVERLGPAIVALLPTPNATCTERSERKIRQAAQVYRFPLKRLKAS